MAGFRTSRFGKTRSRPRSALVSWWNLWRVPTVVTILAAVWWFAVRPVTHEQGWVVVNQPFSLCGAGERTPGCVVDGDTLRLDIRGSRTRRIRLTGFDAPEMQGACEAESALARQAREALLAWLAQGPFEWSGAQDPPRDQYGRELRAARRAGPDGSPEYLADVLVEAGLADDRSWGEPEIDWCR